MREGLRDSFIEHGLRFITAGNHIIMIVPDVHHTIAEMGFISTNISSINIVRTYRIYKKGH